MVRGEARDTEFLHAVQHPRPPARALPNPVARARTVTSSAVYTGLTSMPSGDCQISASAGFFFKSCGRADVRRRCGETGEGAGVGGYGCRVARACR